MTVVARNECLMAHLHEGLRSLKHTQQFLGPAEGAVALDALLSVARVHCKEVFAGEITAGVLQQMERSFG